MRKSYEFKMSGFEFKLFGLFLNLK